MVHGSIHHHRKSDSVLLKASWFNESVKTSARFLFNLESIWFAELGGLGDLVRRLMAPSYTMVLPLWTTSSSLNQRNITLSPIGS
jgi:hypothetical protein